MAKVCTIFMWWKDIKVQDVTPDKYCMLRHFTKHGRIREMPSPFENAQLCSKFDYTNIIYYSFYYVSGQTFPAIFAVPGVHNTSRSAQCHIFSSHVGAPSELADFLPFPLPAAFCLLPTRRPCRRPSAHAHRWLAARTYVPLARAITAHCQRVGVC